MPTTWSLMAGTDPPQGYQFGCFGSDKRKPVGIQANRLGSEVGRNLDPGPQRRTARCDLYQLAVGQTESARRMRRQRHAATTGQWFCAGSLQPDSVVGEQSATSDCL